MFRQIRRMSVIGLVVATVVTAVPVASSQAAVIAGWDVSSYTASGTDWHPSPLTPSTQDPNVTVGGLTRNWSLGSGTAAAYAWGGNNFSTTATDAAGAIAAGNFVTFSLTAAPSYNLSISDIPAYNIRHSGTGPNTGIWQYQVGAGNFVDIGSAIAWGSTTTSAGNAQTAIDLSGISALQNVPAGTTVTFRVITWGATSAGGTWYFNEPTPHTTDPEIAVEGTLTAVPEPVTISLLVMGLGLLGVRRGRSA